LPVLLALTLIGCGRQLPPSASAQPLPSLETAEAFDTIRLARTACFGHCPVYSVEIGRNGKGTYVGEEWVKAKGKQSIQVAQVDTALLSAVLARSGFWRLKDHYQSKEDGCEEMWTDQPSLSITVSRKRQAKTVDYYHGCRGKDIPAATLNWLADSIDYLVNTRPLVFDPNADK
jgi:hypothetical protein